MERGKTVYYYIVLCTCIKPSEKWRNKKKLKIIWALIPKVQNDAQLGAVTYFVYMSPDGYYVVKQSSTFEILSATKDHTFI